MKGVLYDPRTQTAYTDLLDRVNGSLVGELISVDPDGQSALLTYSQEQNFHLGPGWRKPAEKVKCSKCGSEKFEVAVAEFYTAIRCPKCKIEICIHKG